MYDRLKEAKREAESFSDVALGLTDSPTTGERIAELAGGLGTELAAEAERSSEVARDGVRWRVTRLLDANVLATWGDPERNDQVVPYLQAHAGERCVTS